MKRSLLAVTLLLLFAASVGCGRHTSTKGKIPANDNPNNTNTTGTNNTVANNTTSNTSNNTSPNATTCDGCMLDGACVPGDSAEGCGFGGAACVVCTDGWACFDGGCIQPPSCGPDSCAGCCDPVQGCVTGGDEAACGSGGGACAVCMGDETCDGTTCVGACADTCAGCCDGETCLPGSANDSCGTAGGACTNCGAGSTCSAQHACVATSCATSCAGCCNGNTCETGTVPGACGAGGDSCVACGNGRACMNQACVVDPSSRWELVLVSGEVSTTNPMGDPWDIIGSPDPVVDFELIDPQTTTAYRGTSSVVQDDATPTWNESVLQNVPARAFMHWTIDVWDSDLDLDDAVCSIDLDVDAATYQDLFSGAVYTFSCSDPGTGVFADINVRLQ